MTQPGQTNQQKLAEILSRQDELLTKLADLNDSPNPQLAQELVASLQENLRELKRIANLQPDVPYKPRK